MDYAELREIDIDEVDISDDSFLISFPLRDPALEKILIRTKILTPIWVLGGKPYVPVHGFRRIHFARTFGLRKIPALILNTQRKLALRQAIFENLFRGLNLIEKSNAVQKLLSFGFSKEEVFDYMSLMGLGKSSEVLETLLRLSEAEEDIKMFVFEKSLSLKTVKYLTALGRESQKRLIRFLRGKRITESLLREFLEDLILAQVRFKEIPFSEFEESQTIEEARISLKRRLNPIFSKLSEHVEEIIRSMEFPPNVRVSLDPYLERDELEVRISARNITEISSALAKISKTLNEGGFAKLFEIYEGRVR